MNYNRWHVYEWCKQSYMFSGEVPTKKQVLRHFKGTDPEEIVEGMIEFVMTVQKGIRPGPKGKGYRRGA